MIELEYDGIREAVPLFCLLGICMWVCEIWENAVQKSVQCMFCMYGLSGLCSNSPNTSNPKGLLKLTGQSSPKTKFRGV